MTTLTIADTFQVRVESPLEVTVLPGDPGAPALYVLDAAYLLDAAHGVVSMLHTLAGLVGEPFPNLTLVGVGYPTRDPLELFARRAHDLTPTSGERNVADLLPPLSFGGAPAFLSTLVQEVIPHVEGHYDVSRDRRVLAGFSFSGLFGVYTLFTRTDTFTDYLLGSPSLWWDGGIPAAWETDWAAAHDDLPARVFLWVGSEEQTADADWRNERFPLPALRQLAQVDRLAALVDRLASRGYPSLRLDHTILAGEYHLTAPPAGLTRGLLSLLDSSAQ